MTGQAIGWRGAKWGAILALLLAPAVAMLFTEEMNWGAEDFAAAAALLVGGGLLHEIATRGRSLRTRLAGGALVILAVALIWAELAVGIL